MTDNTQPEALRLADAIKASGQFTNLHTLDEASAELRRQHTRIAELEAELEAVGAGGVQALSAAQAGAVPQGWKAVPVNPTPEMWKAAKSVPDPNPPYPPHYGLVWDAMLAASPTPPAEQQATVTDGYVQPVPDKCDRITWRGRYYHLPLTAQAPKAAPGEQNAVSAEWLEQAYREGWAACRDAETIGEEAEDWAFGNSTANSRMIDAQQAAPQQEAPVADEFQPCPSCFGTGVDGDADDYGRTIDVSCGNCNGSGRAQVEAATEPDTAPSRYREACTQGGRCLGGCFITEPCYLTVREMARAARAQVDSVTAPQPAPDCHHRPPCNECAALAAQGGKV